MADLTKNCETCGLLVSTVETTGLCGFTMKENSYAEGECALRELKGFTVPEPEIPKEKEPVLDREHWMTLAMSRADEIDDMTDERDHWKRVAQFHQSKAEYWLKAYQDGRVKHVGDYTRRFVRRPGLRRLIVWLMRL